MARRNRYPLQRRRRSMARAEAIWEWAGDTYEGTKDYIEYEIANRLQQQFAGKMYDTLPEELITRVSPRGPKTFNVVVSVKVTLEPFDEADWEGQRP